jgi:ribose transport system permease protein
VTAGLRAVRGHAGALALPVLIVAVSLAFGILRPVFLTLDNGQQLLKDSSVVLILAVGQAIVVIAGGFDLSVGATMSVVSIAFATMALPIGTPAAIVAALLIGLAIGCANGILVARLHLSPFIVTVAVASILRSAAFIRTNGLPVFGMPDDFGWAATGLVGPLPLTGVLAILVFMTGVVLARGTPFGVHLYATGSNRGAARLSGLDPDRILFSVYAMNGVLAALAGIMLTSRVFSGQPNLAPGIEIQVLAAVFLGGVSLSGGRGSLSQVFCAVILLEVLTNGLTLVGVQSYLQQVVAGAVLIGAISIQRLFSRRDPANETGGRTRLLNVAGSAEPRDVTDVLPGG